MLSDFLLNGVMVKSFVVSSSEESGMNIFAPQVTFIFWNDKIFLKLIHSEELKHIAHQVIEDEKKAIAMMAERIDDSFAKAVEMIFSSHRRVIITGIGKKG